MFIWLLLSLAASYWNSSKADNQLNVAHGLLSNLENMETSKYFTSKMEIDDAALFLGDRSNFLKAATADSRIHNYADVSKYLFDVHQNASSWYFTKREIFHRDEIKKKLKWIIESQMWLMTLLLGPDSSERSRLLTSISYGYNKVLYVDFQLTHYKDLLVGLAFAIRSSSWFSSYDSVNQKWLIGFLASLSNERKPSEWFSVKFNGVSTIKGVSRVIRDSNVPKLTVIFDSVNILFERKDEKELNILSRELSALVGYTKSWHRVYIYAFSTVLTLRFVFS
jgi:hypothetical protein